VHAKQVFTYLKLRGLKLGFVLNFGANLMKDGIELVVNGLPEENLGVLASWRETKTQVEPVAHDRQTRHEDLHCEVRDRSLRYGA
jgi:hypothetical protein